MKFKSLLATAALAFALGGCTVKTDDNPDVVTTPGRDTTVIEKGTPDVNVSPPDVNVKTETPASGGGGSTVTTG